MGYKIVIVDDEQEITENLKDEINELTSEFEIKCCNYGYDALNEVFQGNVSLVISDIAMPDMDGYELYNRIKDYKQELPIIMMTGFGYDPNHVLVNIKKFGKIEVLLKPFDTEKLLQKIRFYLQDERI
ncbi:response regulator [bacterium]|nr:response regulator [bacterium]